MTVVVDDRAFRAGLNAYLERLKRSGRDAARHYADSVVTFSVAHIKSASGDLAGAMGVDDHLEEEPPYIIVGAFETDDHPHALETEFGTFKEQARPFFRPALDEAVRDFTVKEP